MWSCYRGGGSRNRRKAENGRGGEGRGRIGGEVGGGGEGGKGGGGGGNKNKPACQSHGHNRDQQNGKSASNDKRRCIPEGRQAGSEDQEDGVGYVRGGHRNGIEDGIRGVQEEVEGPRERGGYGNGHRGWLPIPAADRQSPQPPQRREHFKECQIDRSPGAPLPTRL
jgi:hypothetical protein